MDRSWPIRQNVAGLAVYKPGKPIEEVQRELGLQHVIKLASNENPLGPSPKALNAIRSALENINLYPDGSGYLLKGALGREYGLKRENIALGSGADEIIKMIAMAFLEKGDVVLSSDATFSQYGFAAQLMGNAYVTVPLNGFRIDLRAMAARLQPETKLIFIANPNNPTGTIVTREELEDFISFVGDKSIIVLDEAYSDYVESQSYPEGLKYVRDGKNVIVMRTFSKAYGLAGLRVGYCLAREDLISAIERVRLPFNVNLLAQVAGVAALEDKEHLARTKKVNSEGKRYLYSEFERLGLEYIPSEANFILVRVGDRARDVFTALLKRGVIVRTSDIFGLPEFIRVTIGTQEQNSRFISSLASVLNQVYPDRMANNHLYPSGMANRARPAPHLHSSATGRLIAIDGPGGVGKSTIARKVAARLGYRYINTGFMYRAITLKAIREGIDITDGEALTELARRTAIEFAGENEQQRVIMDGIDVTDMLLSPEVDALVSPVSEVSGVRAILTEKQRQLARGGDVVMEGRFLVVAMGGEA